MNKSQELIYNKFIGNFKFNIVNTDKNPSMKDSEKMNNCNITITSRATGKKATFGYSQGLGIIDLSDESRVLGLIGCLMQDRIYTDLSEFDGLGYEGSEAVRVYSNIVKQTKKAEVVGLIVWMDILTESDKEALQ